MTLNADRIYSELIAAGDDWADKDAAAILLEQTKSSVLANLAIASGCKTVSEAERHALASPDYRFHVEHLVEARKAANKARVKYQAIQTLAELRRSQESTRRQEMRLV